MSVPISFPAIGGSRHTCSPCRAQETLFVLIYLIPSFLLNAVIPGSMGLIWILEKHEIEPHGL